MARIEGSVEISSPVAKVFSYTSEAKSWPEWQSIIIEAEQISQGHMRVGTTFKGKVHMMGLTMKWTGEVTEYEQNRNWTKKIISGDLSIIERVTYDHVKRGTKFTIVYDMKIGGFMKLFSPMLVNTMRRETRKSLHDLKNILKAQT